MTPILAGQVDQTPEAHVVFLVDRSGSADSNRTEWLLAGALSLLRQKAAQGSRLWVSLLFFNDGLRWASARPMAIEEARWELPPARGTSHLGDALELLAHQLRLPGVWKLPLTVVLLSDGHATDRVARGLGALQAHPRGAEALWVVLPLGQAPHRPTMALFEAKEPIPGTHEALRSLCAGLQELIEPSHAA